MWRLASYQNFIRAISIALLSFLIGSVIDYLSDLETEVGLDTLFKIRGSRPPPDNVVVVAMDEVSETRLGVGQDLTRWRGFQAGLVNELHRQGAALIVFDLQFLAPHPEHDTAFAEAMLKAGNVLVSECVQKFRRGDRDFFGREECSESNKNPPIVREGRSGELSDELVVMRSLLPYPLLKKSALDHAPFHLTNDPGNAMIRESWTFLIRLPTCPVCRCLPGFIICNVQGHQPE